LHDPQGTATKNRTPPLGGGSRRSSYSGPAHGEQQAGRLFQAAHRRLLGSLSYSFLTQHGSLTESLTQHHGEQTRHHKTLGPLPRSPCSPRTTDGNGFRLASRNGGYVRSCQNVANMPIVAHVSKPRLPASTMVAACPAPARLGSDRRPGCRRVGSLSAQSIHEW
jgi:hypothetical protein